MIEFESILIRAFWSYGDYDTVLKLDNLGPCLITGIVSDKEDESGKFSNGAGKSALVEAILWCLFGRTMRIPNPGDKVINFFVGKGCVVELTFKNGDKIRRTRKSVDGHDDLLFIKSGADGKNTEDISLGTNKIEQKRLERLLGLDWDIFCGSTFFSQFGQSWMEISDTKRKEALEREFHMDRIQHYADVAKDRLNKAESEQQRFVLSTESATNNLNDIKAQIIKFTDASQQFEQQKLDRIAAIQDTIADLEGQKLMAEQKRQERTTQANAQLQNLENQYQVAEQQRVIRLTQTDGTISELTAQLNSIVLNEVGPIQKQWDAFSAATEKLESKQREIFDWQATEREIRSDISIQDGLIKKWKNKGPVCSECERPYDSEYLSDKTKTPQSIIDALNLELADLVLKIKTAQAAYTKTKTVLESKRPTTTLTQVEAQNAAYLRDRQRIQVQINTQKTLRSNIEREINPYRHAIAEQKKVIDNIKVEKDHFDEAIVTQRSDIAGIQAEENHYDSTIDNLTTRQTELTATINDSNSKISKLDKLILHLRYIYRAYSDRRNIKSYMLEEYIPYLNTRIAYYLNRFGLDLKIEFTNALGIKCDKWGYQQFSGGECKRFDVAMMLAMFDLHSLMYGRHCNIIVFDEVDGRLDMGGAEVFADIIKTDFADKVDSIFVISQRLDMRGSLASEIKIVREDRCSRIAEVLK